MKIVILQPAYPTGGTVAGAENCLEWMQAKLDELQTDAQDLILMPEYATAPGLNDRQSLRAFAEAQGAAFLEALTASAARLGSLIALAAPVRSGARWFNRTLVLDGTGNMPFTYDKVHLTDAEMQDLGLTCGSMPSVYEHEGIRMGFATCFDLYFPEHFAMLAGQRADLVLCPSYQRSETADRICSMAQARALDSGTYLVRSSYAMEKPDTGGHSLVAAPDGALLADAGSEAGVVTVELDPGQKFMKPASHGRPIVEHRTLIESHRRPAIYRPHGQRARQIGASPFPRICAHRGLSRACPENSIPAFAAAVACGAHEIEFDVRTSRDGVLVVCHDEAVDRTTDGAGKLAELDWRDISKLDVGAHEGAAWRGVRIPRVEEVLEVADGRVGLNVHIKPEGPECETVKRVCDLLTERGLTEIAYVALETEAALQIALEYAPDVPRACLVGQPDPFASIDVAQRHACRRIQFSRAVKPEHTRRAHDLGLICNLFWSDEPQEAKAYVRGGIDVVLTNCAHTMIAGGFEGLSR